MLKRRTFCLLLALLLLLPMVLTGCGNKLSKNTASFKSNFSTERSANGTVAENDNFKLMWDDATQCALLYDKANDQWYGSAPYEYYKDETQYENMYVNYKVYNPLKVSYISVNELNNTINLESAVSSLEGSVELGGASSKLIENGVRLTYNFPDQEFTVVLELRLTDTGLEARIPMGGIRENNNLIYEISVMPYMVSAAHGTGNYVMIPSGGGALVDAKDRDTEVIKSEPVYGADHSESVTMIKEISEQAYLPVFGSSANGEGMLGIISEGAASARVNVIGGDADTGYTTAYASFCIRGNEKISYRSNTGHEKEADSFSDSVVGYKYLSVQYRPLTGGATYVDMANTYRQYLTEEGFLKDRPESTPALSVNFLGSTQITESFFGIPYQTDTVTTTLAQTQSIAAELKELIGGKQLLVTLSGYGQGGLSSTTVGGGFKLSNKVGNKKDWNSLLDFAKQNNTVVALDYDLITFQSSGSGFSVSKSAARNLTGLEAYLRSYSWSQQIEDEEGLTWYLVARSQLGDAVDKAIASGKKLGLSAVSFNTLSNMAYGDYREAKYSAKALMDTDVSSQLKKVSKENLQVVSTRANAYAAVRSDYITDVPMQSSKYTVYDAEIPFYALVFQGYKALTSATINTAVDVRSAYLDAVATGTTLQFTLCNNHHDALQFEQDTAYISSRYEDWKGDIAAMVQESADLYEKVGGKAITAYEQLNGLTKTVFENGVTVYVNYTDADMTSPLGTVPAMGFVYG